MPNCHAARNAIIMLAWLHVAFGFPFVVQNLIKL
jgi:hypothetical protein